MKEEQKIPPHEPKRPQSPAIACEKLHSSHLPAITTRSGRSSRQSQTLSCVFASRVMDGSVTGGGGRVDVPNGPDGWDLMYYSWVTSP